MSNRRWKNFLVAVRDLDHPPRALLTKAARIAQRFEGRLELLHVIALPYVLPASVGDVEEAKAIEIERQERRLERIANRLRKVGAKVVCTVTWDFPAGDAIVRYVLTAKPDVVLAESHHHNKLARWFVTHTEWELIRSCPAPLWLVKTSRMNPSPRILTAIDPFHGNSKPAALDEEILRVAALAAGTRGRIGSAHIHAPPVTMVAGGIGEPVWIAAPEVDAKRLRQRIVKSVDDVADRHGIRKADRIVQAGDAAVELPAIADDWKADLLVMGAVSRSLLKRAFIGHTAERVIDAVHCDVLIVKPRSFKTSVSRRVNRAVVPVPPI
ncbi:MAG TPA: universal stress protein [Steroidobacteraceae bacterium]|nr:universal stress protein [Steroidobacteraceae bacterium]